MKNRNPVARDMHQRSKRFPVNNNQRRGGNPKNDEYAQALLEPDPDDRFELLAAGYAGSLT